MFHQLEYQMLVVNEKRLVKHRNSFSTVWTHSLGRHDRGEYIKVGSTENLSAPGVIFRYASYVREQEALLGYYLDCYHENLGGV